MVEHVCYGNGARVPDTWRVTREGYRFLAGGRVAQAVWTYRGEFQSEDPTAGTVTARSAEPGYEYREEYARRALPVFAEATQGVLLDA